MIMTENPLGVGDLKGLDYPPPVKTGWRWEPIPHDALLEGLAKSLADRGFAVGQPSAALSPDGLAMVASMDLTQHATRGTDSLSVGVVNDNSGRQVLTVFCGYRINGGGVVMVRKSLGRRSPGTLTKKCDAAAEVVREAAHTMPVTAAALATAALSRGEALSVLACLRMRGKLAWTHSEFIDQIYAEAAPHTALTFLTCAAAVVAERMRPLNQLQTGYSLYREALAHLTED